MKLETTKGGETKCWLTPNESESLIQVAQNRSLKHHAVILLGLKCGLRANEITTIQPDDMHQQAGTFFLRIEDAKDTRQGGDGKTRDAYLPRSVEHTLLRLQSNEGIDENETFLPVTTSRIRQMVMEVAEDVAQEIEAGEDHPGRPNDWRKLSSHDLRRYFAQTALLRKDMSPSVVMTVGGWGSMQALEPYLTQATPEEVAEEFQAVGWN